MESKNCIKPKMLTFCLSLFFTLLAGPAVFAQQLVTVTGLVTSSDDGMGLPGVNVMEKGTSNVITTDIDGNYQVAVNPDAVLVFSYVGFASQEVAVNNQTNLSVTMQPSASELEEIVVVGYGTQKKKVSTAAATVVSGKDLVQTNSIDAVSAVQGQSSGVSITSTSGQPGAAMLVNIRGAGTAGNNTPLYVVDGVVVDGGISYLDPSIIERIDILKDASAASIYGARAANGVVLVTTKKGSEGKMNISFNSYTGFQYAAKKLDVLNAREYATIMNEARVNSGFAPLYSQSEISQMQNTDWQDEMFNDGAIKQNHSLLVSGGDKRATYTTGLSYYGQEGLIGSQSDQSQYDRITFTVNTTYDIIEDHLKFGENFSYANVYSTGITDDGIYNNSIRGFLNAPPNYPVYDENGEFGTSPISADITNPAGSLYYNNFNENKINRYVGNLFLEANFLDGFTFRTSYGIDVNNNNYRSFTPVYQLSSVDYSAISSVTQNSTNDFSWTFENTLQYKKTLGERHNIDVLVGTSARQRVIEFMQATGQNLIFNDFEHAYLSNATNAQQNIVSGGRTDYSIMSYFGRLLYDFDNKYLLTATIRRDGSSEFGSNNKFAIFPAFSAGWNIDQENFFPEDIFLTAFKLRGSWGQNGNDQFARQFAYMSTISSYDKNYHFGTGSDELPLAVGSSPDALSNPNLKWETSEQLNLGFDATLFNNLTVSFDYYDKTTKDWLVQAPAPAIAGAEPSFINGGDINNRGIELGLAYNTSLGDDWRISVNGNFSYNQNEVTRVANENGIIYGETDLLFQGIDEINRVEVGQPIGYFYGLQSDGIFQNQAEIDAHSSGGNLIQPGAQPGDVRFIDRNGDGMIDQNDKTNIGDPNPDFYYGFNVDLSYKAFDLSIYTYGVGGNQNINGVRDNSRPFYNYTTDVLDRWTGEGTSNTVPRATYGTTENRNYTRFSDLYVEDAGFFRIKAITLGCDITKLTDKLDVFSQFRIYGTVNNLFTFTKYRGLDPEVGFGNVNQSWARGIDVGYYPQPRTYMLGLSANF